MQGSTKLFRIFGVDIKIHFSWWFVFILLAWSLSSAFFPQFFPNHSSSEYWFMGIVASLLLFVSVLLHELAHSLVAKLKHIKVESITLFFFGGVAGITKEDMRPSSEFLMAIAGPIFSLFLAGIFYLVFKINGNEIWTAITFYLYQLNLILAIFNLIPGFPLDGGRALRAILYAYFKDLKKATKIAVHGGKFFAGFLVILGIFSLFSGIGSGLWFIFLGGFLYFIAGVSYEQVVIKEALSPIKVKELINKKIIFIKPNTYFFDFVKTYANTESEVFVVKDKNFIGILNLNKIDKMSPELQQHLKLKQIALPLLKVKTLNPEDNAYDALKKFSKNDPEILPVKKKDKLLGFVTRKSLMHRLVWELKYNLNGNKLSQHRSQKKHKKTKS